jgi:phosphatidate cytidylyltransferase
VPVAASAAKGGGGDKNHAPGYRGIKLNWDWVTRPLFGGALAALAIAAIFYGLIYIALFCALAAGAGAREWHRMLGETVFGPTFFITTIAIAAALATHVMWPVTYAAWFILAAGASVAAAYAALRGHHPVWHGAGPIYLGTAMLALLLLRGEPQGAWIVIGLFIAIWATDTGALILGNLIGGPRLWPAISPSKTWAGTLGGIATAAIAEAVYIAILGGHPVPAGLLGAGLAVVSICGDLFESWVKRRFQRKDSGTLIPGHGGVLDRIDSTLFAAPVLAVIVIVVGLSPMFVAHP